MGSQQDIRITSWNINGLGATKLDLHDTLAYLETFQIIILTETRSVRVDILSDYQRFEIPTSTVDSSQLESDHFHLCVTLQCSLAPQPGAVPGADGTPLPKLSWGDAHHEAYVQALDGFALDACTMLAAQGSISQACEQLSAAV